MVCQTSKSNEELQTNLAAVTHPTDLEHSFEPLGISEQTCEEEVNMMGHCVLTPKAGGV